MRLQLLSLLVISLAVPAVPAGAQDVPATAVQQDKPEDTIVVKGEKDPKKKVICRGAVATGSLFRKQTCLTQADWQARDEKDKEDAKAMQDEHARRRATQQVICAARNTVC
jgi:hypothetical protein